MGLLRRLFRHDSRPLARADALGYGAAQVGMGTGAPGGQWVNALSGMGGPADRAQRDEYVAGPPVDQWLADALLETNAIAHRIAAQEPEDATREGYDLVRPGTPRGRTPERLDAGVADAVEEACEGGQDGRGLGLLGCLARARTWARAHGGGAIVPLVDDGRQPWEPIDRASIRRVVGLLDADRWELPVVEWGRDGRALIYQLNLNRPGGGPGTMRIHRDRVIRLDGRALPRRRSMVRQGWGGSVFDQVIAPLRGYGTTQLEVQEAIRKLNQGVLTMASMGAGLEVEGGAELIQARLLALSKALGTYNEVAIGQGESYQIHNRSISGIGDAVKAAVDALVASADGMPRLVLLGEVTAGFSNASDGELRKWYDTVAARQPVHYTPAVAEVVRLVMLSHEGPTQGRLIPFSVAWRPLWALSETEAAARDLSRAQRRQVDVAAQVVSPAEARRDPALVEIYGPLDPAEAPSGGVPGEEPGDQDPMADIVDEEPEPDGVVQLVPEPPSTKPMPPDLLTLREAAGSAGLSVDQVKRLCRSGALPYWNFGGVADRSSRHWRVSAADLARLGQAHVGP